MNSIAHDSYPVFPAARSRVQDFDFKNFTFGVTPTDHIFLAEYKDGAWGNARIEPYHALQLSPFALSLHYGQTVFEGFKAFRMQDKKISIFRPHRHHRRLNISLQRMCMAEVPEELFMDGMAQLIRLEKNWIPEDDDVALYIRPFVIATEARLGVKVSDEYLFAIVCTPISKYYAKPLKVKVETEYVRAVEGGTGYAKCGGNYGAAFYPAQVAKEQGYDQVIWTDGKHNEYIEESGTMNIIFVINGTLVTPSLSGSILDGVTRNSILQLAKDTGIPYEERRISYKELQAAFESGQQVEAFGAGTAAVIAPIECIDILGKKYYPYTGEAALMYRIQKQLADIRLGKVPDPYDWNYIIA
jgi:branched-chain amino acid aminotransferase